MPRTSRDASPRILRRLLGGPGGATPREGFAAAASSAAYLQNVLWWTQKASLRTSERGLQWRRTLTSKPRMASAGELRNGSLLERRACVEVLLANGVRLRIIIRTRVPG